MDDGLDDTARKAQIMKKRKKLGRPSEKGRQPRVSKKRAGGFSALRAAVPGEEEMWLLPQDRRRCRLAELLAQSKCCSLRRARGGLLKTRPRGLVGAGTTGTAVSIDGNDDDLLLLRCPRLPLGSGTLGELAPCGSATGKKVPHDDVLLPPSDLVEKYSRFTDAYSNDEVAVREEAAVPTAMDLAAPGLVAFVRHLFAQRRPAKEVDRGQPSAADTAAELQLTASGSVAVAVLVEELTRDLMVSWGDRAMAMAAAGAARCSTKKRTSSIPSRPVGPLPQLTKRTLAVAARLQLNGCDRPSAGQSIEAWKATTTALLRNRLEVLFGQNVGVHAALIRKLVNEAFCKPC